MGLKKFSLLICASISTAVLSGCASIVSRSEYPVVISTNAPGATVVVREPSSGLVLGKGPAPFSTKLKAGTGFFESATYFCEVIDDKNKKQVRPINSRLDAWFLGNFIIGGVIGMAVDGITGAMFKLDEHVYVHFSEYDK